MIFSRKLLQCMEVIPASEPAIIVSVNETSQLLEDEIQDGIAQLSKMRVETDDYNKGSESVKNLCEALEKHDKTQVELRKIDLQIAEANRRQAIDWGQMTPKLISIVAYAGVTCVLLCLERQTPLSMRWLKSLDVLVAPKM